MAKVKLTKTALKQQRDDLKQFQRFLPTLQLKKQQLQMEMRSCQERIRSNEEREKESKEQLASWLVLFGAEAEAMRVADNVRVERVETARGTRRNRYTEHRRCGCSSFPGSCV